MKTKRILALAIAVLLCISFASCRPKDEIAITYKGDNGTAQIKTSLYMCFLIEAEQEFQQNVSSSEESTTKAGADYKELKYEDKDYDTWVKDKAKEYCNEYAFYELEFKRLGLEISKEESDYLEQQYYSNYWSQYYKDIYETNGVSYKTYLSYMEAMNKKTKVYDYYIEDVKEQETTTTTTAASTKKGETTTAAETTTTKKVDPAIKALNGSYRPADNKINSTLSSNYVLVDKIEVSLTDSSTGTALDSAKKKDYLNKLKGYAKLLKTGKSFAEIYKTYKTEFNVTDDSSTTSTTSTDDSSKYEAVLASAIANKTNNNGKEADDYFTDAYKMKIGDIEVKEYKDSYVLIVRKNVMKDKNSSGSAYKDSYLNYAIDILVKDKFQKEVVEKAIEKFSIDENSSAIKFYKPNKIDYGTTTTAAATSAVSQ